MWASITIPNPTLFCHQQTHTIPFFYKQPVYKQVAPGWQITKQLSGLRPPSLSNSKNQKLKKTRFFPL